MISLRSIVSVSLSPNMAMVGIWRDWRAMIGNTNDGPKAAMAPSTCRNRKIVASGVKGKPQLLDGLG